MPVNKGVWGIDIGQSALKALRLEMVEGKPTATAFDYVEHTKILSQPDADPDTLIREALDKFLSRNDLKNDDVALAIAGQSGLARFVKLPPVEEKKIAEIVKFEAKQQIPFPLDEVVWDFQKIAGGGAVDGFALETEIGLFAMKRDVIARYLGYFTGTKAEVHFIQMTPLALVNFATYELLKAGEPKPPVPEGEEPPEEENPTPRGKKRCTVVMDVGTDASNLIITDGGKIIWQRPIPLGGNNFTRALTKELKLTFAKAEHLKRNAAKSPDMASILRAIKPVLTDFVGEVQRSLGYFTNTHRDAHVAHLVGLGSAFKLPGLQKYLADKLSLEVKKPARFDRLAGETVLNDPLFQENLLTFPVAYGLALQGLGQARLTTNLLPREIAQERIIRSKKPYAAAAAAALVFGLAGMSMGFADPYSKMKDKRIDDAASQVDTAASAADKQAAEFTGQLTKSKEEEAKVKKIIAGQEERLNWPRWFEVFTEAMPQPGPAGNLNETAFRFNSTVPAPDQAPFNQAALWKGEGNAGVEALAWFNRRMREGVKIDEAVADANSDKPKALAIVNVRTVHSRWVNDVNAFLQAADTQVQEKFNYAIADFMKDDEREQDASKTPPRWKPKGPAEPGWVIEVRGYTDHEKGRTFVHQALLRNLQRADEFAAKGETVVRNQKGELVRVKSDQKVGQFIVGATDPVKGRISHAFVYNVFNPNPDPPAPDLPGGLLQVNRGSYLDALVGGTGNPNAPGGLGGMSEFGMGTGGPMMPSPMGSPTPTPGGPTGTGATPAPTLGPAWTGLGHTGGAAQVGEVRPRKVDDPTRRRSEFVVMLVWREPTPSGTATAAPPP